MVEPWRTGPLELVDSGDELGVDRVHLLGHDWGAAVTGEDDGCTDTRLYDHVFHDDDFPNGVRVERIHGAGHFVHQERPDEINELLLDWMKNEPAGP